MKHLKLTAFVLLLSIGVAEVAVAAPGSIAGNWNCTRSVISDFSAYQQPAMKFRLEPTAWTDLTWGPARAVRGKAEYKNGLLKLYSSKTGDLLLSFQWKPAGAEGQTPRLVQLIDGSNKTRSGEVCYSKDAPSS